MTAGTLASNLLPRRENPDLLRDHRAEFKDEADIAKSRMETILSVSKTSSAQAIITLVFSTAYSRILFCYLANYQVSLTCNISVLTDMPTMCWAQHSLQINFLSSPSWQCCHQPHLGIKKKKKRLKIIK